MKESEFQTILHNLSVFKRYYDLMNDCSGIQFDLSQLNGLNDDLVKLKDFVIDEKRFDIVPMLVRYKDMLLTFLLKFNLNTSAMRLFTASYETLKTVDEWCKKTAGIPEKFFDDYGYVDNGFKSINGDFIQFDFNTYELKEVSNKNYSQKLQDLFNGHTELIDAFNGLSDDEIIDKLSKLRKEIDKYGKSLIKDPCNRRRKIYAEELVKAGIGESVEKIRKGIK